MATRPELVRRAVGVRSWRDIRQVGPEKRISVATEAPNRSQLFSWMYGPGDNLIEFVMRHLRNLEAIPATGGTSLDDVKSLFARYGLMDDVESTHDALVLLYPRLSQDWFRLIDDCNAFQDCGRAVHEYGDKHGSNNDELVHTGDLTVYGQTPDQPCNRRDADQRPTRGSRQRA